jgi:hypothetical protein
MNYYRIWVCGRDGRSTDRSSNLTRVEDLIESKRALAEQVIGAEESWITELDTDQLRQLLVLDRSAMIAE